MQEDSVDIEHKIVTEDEEKYKVEISKRPTCEICENQIEVSEVRQCSECGRKVGEDCFEKCSKCHIQMCIDCSEDGYCSNHI